ncbi:ATP-dependent helicase, partial [uncultured Desulfovibrio sp.]|uniref:3'-5' exonuclease n=1 Tax=uncultured Desulfovibrio sp. TaxID=167968 RepID=UPI002628D023
DKLSEELTARDVPHKRIGKRTSALHSPLFVKAHAALKCLVNPHDETAFLLAHEGLGVDAAEYAQLRVTAAEQGKSGFEVFRENLPVERLETMPSEDDATANALQWFASGGYLFEPGDGERQDFLGWLNTYASEHPLDTIADYLDWLALVDVQDEMPAGGEEPGILLMTCHASKGLEFPCVIIAGCNEGVLPGRQAVTTEKKGDAAAIEDERRLMYVAVTRARDTLILAVRPEREDERPSRFLAELGM